jgi:hypothetical protein
MTPTRPPTRTRLAVALALEGLALFGLVRAAAARPPTLAGSVLALAAGACATLIIYSAWEWSVHHYVYHRVLTPALRPAYQTHHRDHHFRDFPAWRFTGAMPENGSPQAHGSIWQQVVSRVVRRPVAIPDRWFYLIVGAGAVAGGAWGVTRSASFCAGIVASGVCLFHLFGRVHGTIHQPGTHPLLESQPWFRFLARHHYIHHVDLEANQNFLIPLSDWLFGTLRLSLGQEDEARVVRCVAGGRRPA